MLNKKIKINFCGFWGSFDPYNNLFTNILKRHFSIEISDDPDFVFVSNRGMPFEYTKYKCVRIIFMGENISPDFTAFDYAIGFDNIQFGDRYFRLPLAFYSDTGNPHFFNEITYEKAKKILEDKKYFCNFIYNHKSSHGIREELYRTLNEYKKVICPGKFDPVKNRYDGSCSWKEKYEYLKASKFTIAGDSIIYPGFVTEKIVQAYQNYSIPIYVGSTEVLQDFNINSFVWCKSEKESDVLKAIEQVKYLDTHDKEYLNMLMEYPLVNKYHIDDMYSKLEQFLLNIFKEGKNEYRRIRYYAAESFEKACYEKYQTEKRKPMLLKKIAQKIGQL